MTKPKKISFLMLAVAGLAAGFLALQQIRPAQAATADTYQYPCFPYGNPDFRFGQFISGWGYHVGEDTCKAAGTPVYATAHGTVVYSARTPNSYRWGNLIMIEHQNAGGSTAVSLYGHLSDDRRVGAGQQVSKGQLIGFVGPAWTGANGNWEAHIHFGIHPGGYGAAIGTYAWWVHGYENRCCGGWTNPTDYINLRLRGYDYVPVDVAGGGPMYNNGSYAVIFRIRNTGAFTWRKDGNSPNPVRLGTVASLDRGSGFSANGANFGWAGANRLKLDNDTPTGEVATFTALFSSHGVPGRYPECFAPLVEAQQWLPQRPVCVSIDVMGPSWRGQWHTQMITTRHSPTELSGQTSADYLLPGQKLNVKALIKNAGELPWHTSGPNQVRLGTSNPLDRPSAFATGGDGSVPLSENWPAYNRPSDLDGRYDPGTNSVVADGQISTDEIGVFSFTITAPPQPGSYVEYFNPVVDGRQWMPDLRMWFAFRVLDPGYHYEYDSQSQSLSVVDASTSQVAATLRLRNTGRQSWPVGGAFRLGTDRPRDYSSWLVTADGADPWLAPSRPSAIDANLSSPGKATIDPGEVAEFRMTLTVPPVPPGLYRFYLSPVMDGVTWLPEDYGIYFPINVTTPPRDYQVLHQSFSADIGNIPSHSTFTAALAIRNSGRGAWNVGGADAVRLATSRPRDRLSSFADLAGSDPWLSGNRASAIDGRVTDLATLATVPATEIKPGEIALFRLPLATNTAPGSYSEYFNLVTEGVGWFPDYGIYFPLRVVP